MNNLTKYLFYLIKKIYLINYKYNSDRFAYKKNNNINIINLT